MSTVHRKSKSSRHTKASKPVATSPPHVTPAQVVTRLFDLFEHIGIAMPKATSLFAKLQQMDHPPEALYSHATAIGELIKTWHQNPIYLDPAGAPLLLRLRGRRPCFQDLAKKAAPGIKPSQLLSELRHLGIIPVSEQGVIRVRTRAFPAFGDRDLARQYTLSSLNDFILTLRHNLNSVPTKVDQLFHRIAHIESFDRREIPALNIRVRRRGENFLEAIDDWMSSIAAAAKSKRPLPRSRSAKVTVGIYLSVDN